MPLFWKSHRCKKLQILQIYLCYFFQLVLIFGPFWVIFEPFWQFWVIFGPFWAILGHFWAILGNFRSFFGPFLVLIFVAKYCSVLFKSLFATLGRFKVIQGYARKISNQRLQGFRSYEVTQPALPANFQRLQGYRGYESYTGLCQMILKGYKVTEVTGLRRAIFSTPSKVTRLQRLQRLQRSLSDKFQRYSPSFHIIMLSISS